MQKMLWIIGMVFGGVILYRKKYKVMNMLLAFSVFRKIIVAISMRFPLLRNEMMPSVFEQEK
ncbi:hypothetical protein GCM10011351_17150 [Paraliobacillus quinghaiensis]|uniref:Uncharacterized protein n=1 Tax=Paraliobacillus quinghaiensis TaxID=470815 RepID=A0A917TPQ7_9BACI|nr:hypothetical protein [Paraliobacillus quinghaiensis]GGM31549.1 hypothetical protein GCM10011351_17150 [Paraliobacillus quinghaiensis]